MQRLTVFGYAVVACLICCASAAAQGTVKELLKEHADADKAWLAEYREADEGDRAALRQKRPWPAKWFEKVLQAIEKDPASDAALEGASWILTQRAATGLKLDPVIRVLHEHHLAAADLHGVIRSLSRVPTKASMDLLNSLEAESPHDDIRAVACFFRAIATKRLAAMVRRGKSDPEVMASYLRPYGRENVDWLESQDPAKLEAEAEALYTKVQETPAYAKVPYGRSTLKEAAKGDLYELRHLSIGKVAPEIEGEDLDGISFKLSDYRGKVVVLDFWGDW
jgi:hypothetical protein